jgi:hypothetical protein
MANVFSKKKTVFFYPFNRNFGNKISTSFFQHYIYCTLYFGINEND